MARILAMLVTGLLGISALAGCEEDEEPSAATFSTSDCVVGEPPDYYTTASRPDIVIGCTRLGVSGKPVEFVVEGPKPGRPGVLVSPVYGDNEGEDYLYVPSTAFVPRGSLNPIANEIPKQGVRGYELVLWGEADDDEVTAEATGEAFPAATFEVPGDFGNGRLRRVFVVELPAEAACDEITLRDGLGTEERLPSEPKLCMWAKQMRAPNEDVS